MNSVLLFKDNRMVFERTKRHLQDEFVGNEPSAENYSGFSIPNEEFNELEVFTTNTYKPRNFLTLKTPVVGETVVRERKDERLSAFETQQKYALLARASYLEGDKDKVKKLFDNFQLLKDFYLDEDLSSKKNSVFVNERTQEVVVSYKGTNPTNFEDLYDDAMIAALFENENKTKRFREANELYDRVKSKYGENNTIKITGHSLGGSIAMYVGESNDVETHSFNAGISGMRALENDHQNNKQKSYVYRTRYDPVSAGAYVNRDQNRVIVSVEQKDAFDPHSIDNFFKTEQATRTFEDINNDVIQEMFVVGKRIFEEEFKEEMDVAQASSGLSDDEAHALGLDKVADVLKSSKRRDQDKLMALADRQEKSTDIVTDIDGDIVSKGGVRYVQVSGEHN